MEIIDDSNILLGWASMQIEENKVLARKLLKQELQIIQDNYVTLHWTIYNKESEKLQVGKVRVKGKIILEEHDIVIVDILPG